MRFITDPTNVFSKSKMKSCRCYWSHSLQSPLLKSNSALCYGDDDDDDPEDSLGRCRNQITCVGRQPLHLCIGNTIS